MILGMLGPNGAGKATTVRVLTSLLRPDQGTARVGGYDVVTDAVRVRTQIGLTGQYAAPAARPGREPGRPAAARGRPAGDQPRHPRGRGAGDEWGPAARPDRPGPGRGRRPDRRPRRAAPLRSPEAAQALGFIFFLPLSFVSNAFVPTQGMPSWLRDFANWNPLSAVAATCRDLFGGPNPSAAVQAWPMQHPELAVLVWSAALLTVFAPTAVYLYRRKVLH